MTSRVHPLPLPPSEHTYAIRYTVPASTYLEAVDKATALLRSDTSLIGVLSAEPMDGGLWKVRLKVAETW